MQKRLMRNNAISLNSLEPPKLNVNLPITSYEDLKTLGEEDNSSLVCYCLKCDTHSSKRLK